MNFNDIVAQLKAINDKLNEKYGHLDKTTYTLARSLKVTEEYGEFADELLSHLNLQRQDKLDAYDKKKLELEFADTAISLMLLGISSDIDIEKAIKERLDIQFKKWVDQ